MKKDMEPVQILLVDDEEDFRRVTVTTLSRRGFIVTEASSGVEALAEIEHLKPDIVLLDLKMPGMSGIETLEKIREIDLVLPVIILTGHGSYKDALAGIQLQVVDFIQKPIDIDELGEKIRELIKTGERPSLRERTIKELMVEPSHYPKLYIDQPVEEAVKAMLKAFYREGSDDAHAQPLRSALVYDRKESFIGLIRFAELLKLVLPPFLRDSQYSSYFTGMFIAQCKVIGKLSLNEIMSDPISIDVNAPVMEAVHKMVKNKVVNLPVMEQGGFVGIIREKDIIREIAYNIGITTHKGKKEGETK